MFFNIVFNRLIFWGCGGLGGRAGCVFGGRFRTGRGRSRLRSVLRRFFGCAGLVNLGRSFGSGGAGAWAGWSGSGGDSVGGTGFALLTLVLFYFRLRIRVPKSSKSS